MPHLHVFLGLEAVDQRLEDLAEPLEDNLNMRAGWRGVRGERRENYLSPVDLEGNSRELTCTIIRGREGRELGILHVKTACESRGGKGGGSEGWGGRGVDAEGPGEMGAGACARKAGGALGGCAGGCTLI